MTTAHVPSDDSAIAAADDRKTEIAHAKLDEAVAWLKRTPSWAALECVQQRALAAFLDRVRVLESATETGIPVTEQDQRLTANPAPITAAPHGERRPVPRHIGNAWS